MGSGKSKETLEYEYEIMNMPSSKYLCSIPFLEDLPENRTATELARAEEAKELSKAENRGWELLQAMHGDCIYFMPGWWSYRFCYGRDIIQYHALPSAPNGLPPVQDPNTAAFVLGRVPKTPESSTSVAKRENSGQETQAAARPPKADLQVKGDQRYLVQKLENGTTCDITHRPRTIEVQYHCVPTMVNDRIGWIKEITTCAYLMVINTPRLCKDVAFLPPQPSRANPITCRPILTPEEARIHELLSDGSPLKGETQGYDRYVDVSGANHPPVIGGIVVGGHNILAQDSENGQAVTLQPPTSYIPEKEKPRNIVVVAKRTSVEEGGIRETMPDDELYRHDIDPSIVDEMTRELEAVAGDKAYRLEVVESRSGAREMRGIIDEEGEDATSKGKQSRSGSGKGQDSKIKGADQNQGQGQKEAEKESQEDEKTGSEEVFFHDEL